MALVINSDYVTPAELTGYVREALADQPINDLALVDNLLPDTMIDDVEFRANITQHGLRRAAKFRSWDTEAPITGRKGVVRISGELPPISEKRRLGEYDRLRLRKADNQIRDLIFNDGVELAQALRTRIIMAKADALVNGKVTLAENGLDLAADFKRLPGHSVTASVLWNVTGTGAADPINDQESWFATFRTTQSGNPVRAITSQRVMSALMRNDKIRAYALPPGSTQGIVTRDQVNALFTSFGHPAFEIFDAQVEDANGNASRLIPDDRILYVGGANKIGETLWGTTAEAIEPEYGIDANQAPGIVVGSYIDNDPVARWTKASGIGLPMLLNANATMVAKVL
ncbi:major capsid protein [Nocardia cyriacigeorgica]|uniref:Major capsid protein E n=1 Tax=Nocardia cyriacigeorgica TaxID=135487 RepID=A0A5R8NEF4_9NOCA|nr:major capsid protein [Nocardia cyriacigeorgica]TLF72917.1 major capsid protein E [Nocardia cyriacigeorgica]